MHKTLFPALLMLSLSLHTAAQNRAQPVDGFAAEVNGKIITVGDVLERIRPMLARLNQQYQGAERVQKQTELFNDGLEKLIEQRLMIAQFEKQEGQIPQSAVRERREQIIRERFGDNEENLMGALRQVGKTMQEWEDELRDQMIAQSMVQQFVRAKIHVSPREIREVYEEKKVELQQDTELKLRSIGFRPPSAGEEQEWNEKVQTVMGRLAEAADFAEVAREFSEGPKAASGGDEGWVNLSRMPVEIREALIDAQPGETSALVKTLSMSYIFRVEDRRGGETQTLAEAQAALQREIEQEKYQQVYDDWMQGLYNQFQVRRFNPDISAVTGDL